MHQEKANSEEDFQRFALAGRVEASEDAGCEARGAGLNRARAEGAGGQARTTSRLHATALPTAQLRSDPRPTLLLFANQEG